MTLAFYKVDNSQGYDRHTFDLPKREGAEGWQKIKEMLSKLSDEELRMYNMRDTFDRMFFEDDYNNEVLDCGWWCVVIND